MYSIFFDNRRIAVCSQHEIQKNDFSTVHYIPGNDQGLEDLPYLFLSLSNINWLFVSTSDQEATFNQLCKKLTKINAGGGLVTNDEGEVLLIYRNKLWDLPKGKQEKGEEIETTAIREVEEECGIANLKIKEIICKTYHTYINKQGELTVKSTYWYRMEYHGQDKSTFPQLDECIEKAIWVKPSDLPQYLCNTYKSILEVFATDKCC